MLDMCGRSQSVPSKSPKSVVSIDTDPVLTPSSSRFTLFLIQYDRLWALYKKAESSFWVAAEIDLSGDRFDDLTPEEQHFVKHVLAFFAAADGVVLENLCGGFMNDVQVAEARAFYAFQGAMEQIHSETYSILIDTYVRDPAEKQVLFNAIDEFPCVRGKYEWARQYMDAPESFASRLVAFACVEGIFFSGSFCAIFWLKKRGLMPGLSFSNQLISRDEALHTDFACELHRTLKPENRCSASRVREIISSAVAIEKAFVLESLPVPLIGMNKGLMSQYIEFVADRLSKELGGGVVFGTANPFEWMELISLQGKTNFFESRVAEYQLSANVSGDRSFTLTDDF